VLDLARRTPPRHPHGARRGIQVGEDEHPRSHRGNPIPARQCRRRRTLGPTAFRLREAGRRINVNDLWIASVALAHNMPVITQDVDFTILSDLDGPAVVMV